MASPRSIPLGSSETSSAHARSVSAATRPSAGSVSAQVGTPQLQQIPSRGGGTSFHSRSITGERLPSRTISPAAQAASPGEASDTGIGSKTALEAPKNTASALTAGAPAPTLGSSPQPALEIPTPGATGESSTPLPEDSAFSTLADVPDAEKARVLRRHLVSAEERGSKSNTPGTGQSPQDTPGNASVAGDSSVSVRSSPNRQDTFPIPYDAPGGDVTHNLYKWQHDHRPRPNRSASFSHADRSAIIDPAITQMKEPNGFRRNFVVARAQERGIEEPPMIRNFVDFLYLYGHFAGEDLDEDEDLSDDDDEDALDQEAAEEGRPRASSSRRASRGSPLASERTPLMQRSVSRGRKKRTKAPGQGTASTTQAVLMLLKGFVGTGVLFMAKAFFNGGLLFSAVVLLAIAAISLWSFLLLVHTYMKVPGSFGDIGGALYGPYMRLAILVSITVSQIGFVAAYTIFIAENLQAFVMAVTDCKHFIPTSVLIFAQLLLFLPLAMIRNLAKLSGTALVADAFILVGLVYIASCEIGELATKGLADVVWFNKDSFPLLIGTAVFAFEGIGLVIPITESMKEPEKFPRALTGVMIFVGVLFASFGILGYAAYGSEVQTVVLVNLPQDQKFVQASQFLYSIAILLSIPLQLFPAVRIMETGLFSRSGKHNPKVKWQKNIFRACTVLFCSLLSWAGSAELDKFVSLVGAFACIPLCFIYPPMLHLKGCAQTRKAKILDCILLAFGIVVGVYTTVQTLRSLYSSAPAEPPKFGKCDVPKGY